MKRLLFGGLLIVVAAGLLVGGVAFFFLNEAPEAAGRDVVFELRPGPFTAVARDLEAQGLVTSATKLKLLARITGHANRVRVGEYALRTDMTPLQILGVIISGKSIQHPLTVVEGANIYDIGELIERKGFGKKKTFFSLCKDQAFLRSMLGEPLPSCEGYLFPETYGITKYMTEKEIIQQMISRFLQNFEKVTALAGSSGMTRHQIVTLASIVEKETGAPEERPVISSVYHNRLRLGMKLQADPTVLYGKWETTGNYLLSITRQDLITPNPYNTYTKKGLPLGPIANPGLEALKATLQPATSEFLYFVSRNDGTHIFSKDYDAHNRAVQSFQQNSKARQGKSWRDLSKRNKKR